MNGTPTGVVSWTELQTLGWSRADLKANLGTGRLERVARGWFAAPTARPWAIEAVRNSGRLGCLSGCELHGVWAPAHSAPHIVVQRQKEHTRPEWHRHSGPLPAEAIFPLEDCLAQVAAHHDPESALMVLESATNLGLVSSGAADGLIGLASARKRRTLSFFDPSAGSGSETRVRLFLQQHRFPVRSQVAIEGVGHVDLLVGRSLIVECDSAAHHSDHREDRRRDLAARELGYSTLRLSYSQVHRTWPQTSEKLLQLLRTQRHLAAPAPWSG